MLFSTVCINYFICMEILVYIIYTLFNEHREFNGFRRISLFNTTNMKWIQNYFQCLLYINIHTNLYLASDLLFGEKKNYQKKSVSIWCKLKLQVIFYLLMKLLLLKRPTFFSTPCGPVKVDSLSEAGTNIYGKIQCSSVLERPWKQGHSEDGWCWKR